MTNQSWQALRGLLVVAASRDAESGRENMDFTPQELDLIYGGLVFLEDRASLTIGEEEVLKDLSQKILYKLSESE